MMPCQLATDSSHCLHAEEGHEYYVDATTGKTTWNKPVDQSWVQIESKEHGREYYFNTVTQVSFTV